MGILQSLPHRCDHYARTYTKDTSAGMIPENVPTNANVHCWFQTVSSEVADEYKQRRLNVSMSVFLTDAGVYETIKLDQVLRWNGRNYSVRGHVDLSNLGRVFRVDVELERGGA